ncbi:MAG: protein-L-isoaspartate O-methyltransferase [Rhodomicrobium sp.]|nr:protein-L-isoaspartate O-methyltransferase [Rhodomicrobium sp.]
MKDFKAERETMVESQIRPNAVTNTGLLKAMLEMPRERFVPPALRSLAYMDGALRVEPARDGGPARYLLSPMVFAKLVQLAVIGSGDRVLDVGPATGYSTAILAMLAKDVTALEPDAGLAAIAKDALTEAGIENASFVTGPLKEGWPDGAPYNAIFLNGRIAQSPDRLLAQLAPGGRLVTVMGSETAPKAHLFCKIDSTIQDITAFDAGAPLLPGFERQPEFSF